MVNFNQGLDVRFLDKDTAEQLNRVHVNMIHFAWDNYEMNTMHKLEQAREWLRFNNRNVIVYVLTNFNTTIEQDLERIYSIRDIGFDPYVMIYDKPNAPKQIKRLQRWCNNRRIFKSCEWNEYRG